MDIGKAMMEIREEAGISRKEMATKLKIRPQSLWKIEKGMTYPKPKTIAQFCVAAKVPMACLYMRAMEKEDYRWPDDPARAGVRQDND